MRGDITPDETDMKHVLQIKSVIPILAALVLLGCGSEGPGAGVEHTDATAAKIRVYGYGRITVDGNSVSLDELSALVERLKEHGGSVWHYREDGNQSRIPMRGR